MENLSDEEFGAKNVEEAPILIAQRYLNIFRQVHIFNKATRDKFDDELLALPENIIAFIKRMPGGRLLIEHVEEVKTNRGISFIKANRDEFANGSDASGGAVVPMQGGGGNVVMDASFAETLARSLATAFKNVPGVAGGGANFSTPTDMGQAFELIAEEIRASHSSLLDVLKETRNITDSVIASQVSISRILEGLLSSRAPEGGNNELNSQIVASQASITKLLETLCQSTAQKEAKSDVYFDVENRLSRFEREIKDEIKALVANKTIDFSVENNKSHSDFSAPVEKKVDTRDVSATTDTSKKKKKKNKNKEQSASVSTAFVASAPVVAKADALDTVLDNLSDIEDGLQPVGGVIRNSAYKYEDDFSNVDLNEPPLEQENDVIAKNTDVLSKDDDGSKDILSDLDNLDDLDLPSVDEDLVIDPVKEENLSDETLVSDDDLSLDNLTITEDNTNTFEQNLDSLTVDEDDIDTSAQNSDLSLDELTVDKDTSNTSEQSSTLSLGNFAADEDLNTETSSQNEALDSFVVSNQNDTEVVQNDTSSLDNLDDISIESSQNNVQSNTSLSADNTEEASTEDLSLDNFNSDNGNEDRLSTEDTYVSEEENPEDILPKEAEHPSRYNDTLDKIRDALTSDHIDIASIDEPIALDDYSDDENVSEEDITPKQKETSSTNASDDEEWEYEYVEDDSDDNANSETSGNDEGDEWEYEYVDENGNVVTSKGDNKEDEEGEDWEWEYVDDNQSDNSDDSDDENKPQ